MCELLNYKLDVKAPDGLHPFCHEDGCEVRDSDLVVKLVSAKASGELLLSLTLPANPPVYQVDDRKTLMQLMRDMSWRTFHRTFAIESSDMKAGTSLLSLSVRAGC